MDTFEYTPDYDLQVEHNLKDAMREVKLGNGVVQLQKRSLTRPLREFSVKFTRMADEIDAIEGFLINHTGRRFKWTGYGEQPITVYCTKVSRRTTGIVDELSCEFTAALYGG